ncbi:MULTISPECIES: SURF1 family protein [unclassified Streptomyces]|uniref:SURF1 family protein n=1 Tax=unclassified Streptomyces TaxID=2593676 RepID=UPI002DDB3CBB|nr:MULTISPECIES: SURF1 family protein [unclassified Streptomyces]WSB77711.1 SURF1 family protein [Streptomyces sp. NBC_01775]WSS14040.1 SURF1 family protein [Streptomyces sp. NBC_01186]WSS42859.1 SURF1 family protein [Streptomyces sp. NBC_01187]
MYRFLLTPRWWGINILAVLAIPVCLLMGSWQLSRFDDRVENHQQQEKQADSAAHAKASPLARLLPVTEDTVGRTAEVTGRFDAAHPLLVPGRTVEDEKGFYVLSLLRTDGAGRADGTGRKGKGESAKALPVVRGWLPGGADPAKVPPPPKGEVSVKGVLQASESQNDAAEGATGGLPDGQLGFISAAALVNVVPYRVQDAWLTEQHTDKPLRPVPPVAPDNTGLDMKAFQNLGYTAQWFVFAGFVVFMWFRFFRMEAEVARDTALGLIPGGPEEPGPLPEQAAEDDAARSRSPA